MLRQHPVHTPTSGRLFFDYASGGSSAEAARPVPSIIPVRGLLRIAVR